MGTQSEPPRALILLFRCDSISIVRGSLTSDRCLPRRSVSAKAGRLTSGFSQPASGFTLRRSRHSSLVTRHLVRRHEPNAFTLIELLVVIIIIIILMGFLFPAFRGVQDQAKRAQAKNDLTQIVTAVNAYYTEYGKYPVNVASGNTTDAYFGTGTTPSGATSYANNDVLIDAVSNNTSSTNNSATVALLNPRGIVFLNVPVVKNSVSPKSGVIPNGATVTAPLRIGVWYDPWGSPYSVEIDTNYDNLLKNPYGAQTVGGAGSDPVLSGVIAWSFGSDQKPGSVPPVNGDNVYKNPTTGAQSDDVISWQ